MNSKFESAPSVAAPARRVVMCVMLLAAASGPAQEAFRTSLAGQAAAEAKQRALADQNFNLRLGPVGLRFQSQLSIEANDNVRLEDNDPKSDVIVRPQFNIQGVWRVSEKNSLTFSTGIGYLVYLNSTEPNALFITPGSDLSFDLYVKDFTFNFHNRFSYSPDVSNQPQISGIGTLETLENTSGLGVKWDLNKVILELDYDHNIHKVTTPGYSYNNSTMDLLSLSAGFVINPTTTAGLQVSGGMTKYEQNFFNDNSHVAAGPFYSIQLSDNFSLRASGGYVAYFYSNNTGTNNSVYSNNTGTNSSSAGAFFGDLSLRQRVNASYAHSLSVGRLLQSGSFSETLDLIYARYEANWRLFQKTSLGFSLSYEHFTEVLRESNVADRYGFGLSLSRPLTRKLGASLQYHYFLKDSSLATGNSSLATGNYVQNQLALSLLYSF
jgi:hypothetical protein